MTEEQKNEQYESLKEFQRQYIDTLVAVKTALENLVNSQKALNDHVCRNSNEQTKQLMAIAADMRVLREQVATIQLKTMFSKDLLLKKNTESNNNNGNGNGNTEKNLKKKYKSDIKERLDAEEELDKELMYRYIGKFVISNWKFIFFILILASIGTFIIFGNKALSDFIIKILTKAG